MPVATPRRATPPAGLSPFSVRATTSQPAQPSSTKASTTTWPRSVRAGVRGASMRCAGSAATTGKVTAGPAGRGGAAAAAAPPSAAQITSTTATRHDVRISPPGSVQRGSLDAHAAGTSLS